MPPNTGSMSYFQQNPNYGQHYVLPGLPFVTSSVINPAGVDTIQFPYLTKQVTVTNTAATGSGFTMRGGFTLSGVTSSNYFTLEPQQSVNLELRTGYLFLSSSATGTYEVIGEMSSARNFNYPYFQGDVLEGLYGQKGIYFVPKFL